MKLSKTAIDGLQPGPKDRFLWCSELPGFGVRCNPYGRKTFVLRYRTATHTQRMQTAGRCTDFPVAKAREIARGILAEVRSGNDPVADRRTLRFEATVKTLFDRYILAYATPYNRPSTVQTYRQLWHKHLQPAFGNRRLIDVTRADVMAFHASMAATPIPANRSVALLSKMYNLAGDWELVPSGTNPARRIRKYPERIRERVLSAAELRGLLAALEERDVPEWLRLLVKLLLATGCRLGEIRTAKVEWIDWEQGLLLLPASKTGQRRIALSSAALALLEPRKGHEWVIQRGNGKSRGRPIRVVYPEWRALMRRVGLEGVTPHTLRHTVGSQAHKAGLSQREIADLLGHKHLVTTARYLHGFGSLARANADRVASVIGL